MDEQPLAPKTKAFVDWMLYQLTPREERILKERFGLWDGISKTLEAIGEHFALSRERIRQIQNRGLKKLRQLLDPSVLDEFVRTKLHRLLDPQFEGCGVLSQKEAVATLADDCSPAEAKVATSFLKALRDPSRDIFSSCLSELEQGIYSFDPKVSAEYTRLLDATKRILEEHKRPLEEDKLWGEVTAHLTAFQGSPKVPLFVRMLLISPSFERLQDERIVLSHRPDDLTSLAECHNDQYGLRPHGEKDELAEEEQAIRLSKEELARQRKQRAIRTRLKKLESEWERTHPDATPERRELIKEILTFLAEELSGEK